jgi:hypothetical protein
MALELHKDLKARLVEALTRALPLMEVEHAKYFTSRSRYHLLNADNALPDHGPLREKLINFIDDFPMMSFVYDVVQAELLDRADYDGDAALKQLTDLAEYTDAKSVAGRLVEQFDSLPWLYVFSIEMPEALSKLFSAVVEEIQLSPSIKLTKAKQDWSEKYPLNSKDEKRQSRIHGGALLFGPTDAKWVEGKFYLQIEAEGFVGPFGGTACARQSQRHLKAFFGLGLALRLLEIEVVYFPVPPVHSFYVHKAQDDQWQIDGKLGFDSDFSRILNGIKLSEMFDGANDERKKALTKIILDEMKAVFSAGEKAETIALAAEWLLDSYTGRDDRLYYIQSIVVLEVLLGDKAASDEVGLGQLLRNRCA